MAHGREGWAPAFPRDDCLDGEEDRGDGVCLGKDISNVAGLHDCGELRRGERGDS